MNVVFGTANSPSTGGCLERITAHVQKTDRSELHEICKQGAIHVRGAKGLGKAFGFAKEGELSLVLLGHVHAPLSGWTDGSPLDDPQKTANFLLRRYQELGLKFLDNVLGHFNVIVVDGARILLGSDPYDHRKIYYSHSADSGFCFSTNLFSLGVGLGENLRLDRSYEDFLLGFGFWPFRKTPYEGVLRAPAGKILEWNSGDIQFHPITTGDPWSDRFSSLDLSQATEQELIDALHEAFMMALEDQLASDPRAAVLLGGFDSALVASALKELGKEVETFSFFYDDPRYDQPHTDTVEKYLGIKHHWVPIDEAVMTEGIRNYAETFNEPTCWPNYVIGTVKIAEVMNQMGFDHCYSGDGCDSIFFGYPLTYKRLKAVQAASKVPPFVRKPLVKALEMPITDRLLGRPVHVALGMLKGLELNDAERQFLSLRILDQSSLSTLRNGDAPAQERDFEEILHDLVDAHRSVHPVRLAYMGKSLVSPTKAKINGSADRFGVSIFAPFTHKGLKHFVNQIPATMIRPEEDGKKVEVIGKYILIRMAEDKKMLPPEVIHQKKVGAVDAPIEKWYGGGLRSTLLESFAGLPFEANRSYLQRMLQTRFAEKMYGKALARYTNNVTSIMLAPSLLSTFASFTSLGEKSGQTTTN